MIEIPWMDITISVLSSMVGGFFVATFFEFSPYGPNKVRRNVLIALWVLALIAAPPILAFHLWGGDAALAAIFAVMVVGLTVFIVIVITMAKDEE